MWCIRVRFALHIMSNISGQKDEDITSANALPAPLAGAFGIFQLPLARHVSGSE